MNDRVIDKTDNMPPEVLPMQLASVADLPVMMKADIDDLTSKALTELDIYSRVPTEISDEKIYERATTLGTRIKAVIDSIEKRRKAVKQPYLNATTAIDAAFKLVQAADEATLKPERNLRKELDEAHAGIKSRLSVFDTKKFNEEEDRRNKERELLAEAAAKDGIEMDVQAPATVQMGSTKSAHGGAAVRKVVIDWEVVNEAEVPRSLLSIDPAKVQAQIDAGATSIPGLKLTRRVETHVKR